MWTDRLTSARRREVIEILQSVLPMVRPGASSGTLTLASRTRPRDVAEVLQSSPGFVWLDRPGSRGRIFVDPLVRLSVLDGRGVIEGPGARRELPIRSLDLLEAALAAWAGPAGGVLCGYLAYEAGAEIEAITLPSRRREDLPDMVLGLYDCNFEHTPGGWSVSGTDAWRGARGVPLSGVAAESRLTAVAPSHLSLPERPEAVLSEPSEEGFQAMVERIVRRIYAGEVFQVNVCRRLEAPLAADGIWPAYLRLRAASPAEYGAFLRIGPEQAVMSISPERFLLVEGGEVRSCPIKGTRPRGSSPASDHSLAAELAASEKDTAELAMIVDVVRSDLARVCTPGSVTVASHARLISLPTVHHLVSEVAGRLKPECGPADLLRASFPAASISGAPKIHAIELAALEEGWRRGPCMGSIGWLSLDGRMELSVAIRTAVASAGRIWYLAGCGITAESDPSAELAETKAKATAFVTAVGETN